MVVVCHRNTSAVWAKAQDSRRTMMLLWLLLLALELGLVVHRRYGVTRDKLLYLLFQRPLKLLFLSALRLVSRTLGLSAVSP